MCNNSLMSLAYFPMLCECFCATSWLSPRSLHHLQVNSRSVSHVAVLVVYCQSKEGVLQCLCIIFKKGNVGRLQKNERFGVTSTARCWGELHLHLGYLQSIKHYKCAAIHSSASSDLSLIIVSYFFPIIFPLFLGAIDFVIYRWTFKNTSANTENTFSNPDLNQQASGYQEEDLV